MLCREGSALCVHGPAGSAGTEGSLKNRDIEVREGAAAALVGTSLNILFRTRLRSLIIISSSMTHNDLPFSPSFII